MTDHPRQPPQHQPTGPAHGHGSSSQGQPNVELNLSQRVNRTSHPLLQKREGKKIEILVVTSDRGLCGGFNGNIVRKSSEFIRQCEAQGLSVNLSIIGRKGRDYFRRRSWPIRQEWTGIFDKLSFEHAIDRLGIRFESFMEEFSNILQRNLR